MSADPRIYESKQHALERARVSREISDFLGVDEDSGSWWSVIKLALCILLMAPFFIYSILQNRVNRL